MVDFFTSLEHLDLTVSQQSSNVRYFVESWVFLGSQVCGMLLYPLVQHQLTGKFNGFKIEKDESKSARHLSNYEIPIFLKIEAFVVDISAPDGQTPSAWRHGAEIDMQSILLTRIFWKLDINLPVYFTKSSLLLQRFLMFASIHLGSFVFVKLFQNRF